MRQPIIEPDQLSERNRAVLDSLVTLDERGRLPSERDVAAAFDLSQQRVNQLRHSPAGRKYLELRASTGRLDIHLWSLGELRRRIEHGSAIPLAHLIAIFKATMPTEPVLHIHEVRSHAERVADDLGLNGDARRKLIDYALERTRRERAAG
jgi:hypothetical protein